MTIEASLSILSSILSIAVSVKEMIAARRVTAEAAVDELARSEDERVRKALADPNVRESVLILAVISKDLLDQLEQEAFDCEQKHVRGRKRAKGFIDKQQADVDAGQCICGVLRDIKRYNGRKLPDGRLKDLWTSYSCND